MPADVDGVNVRSSVWRLNPREAAAWFGGRPVWTGVALGIEGVIEAALAIATGQCETVVIADAQAGEYTERESTSPWTRPTNEFVASWGLYTAAEFALIARRHMHLYGTRPESLAEVAATIRNHGALNPEAVFHGRHVTPRGRARVAHGRRSLSPARLRDQLRGRRGARAHDRGARRDLGVQPIYLLGGAIERQGMAYVTAPVWDRTAGAGAAPRSARSRSAGSRRRTSTCASSTTRSRSS